MQKMSQTVEDSIFGGGPIARVQAEPGINTKTFCLRRGFRPGRQSSYESLSWAIIGRDTESLIMNETRLANKSDMRGCT